jgi:hypothetical protein
VLELSVIALHSSFHLGHTPDGAWSVEWWLILLMKFCLAEAPVW